MGLEFGTYVRCDAMCVERLGWLDVYVLKIRCRNGYSFFFRGFHDSFCLEIGENECFGQYNEAYVFLHMFISADG